MTYFWYSQCTKMRRLYKSNFHLLQFFCKMERSPQIISSFQLFLLFDSFHKIKTEEGTLLCNQFFSFKSTRTFLIRELLFKNTNLYASLYNHNKIMKDKEKLIITLWRGQIDNPQTTQSVYCRLIYNNQQHNSKLIPCSKSLAWKQTFVFPLAKKSQKLRLDFINMQEDQEIHFAKDLVLDSLSLGKSIVLVNLDHSNRGTIPAKLPIIDSDQNNIGTVFLQYEVIKTEVVNIISSLIDYEFMVKMYDFRLTFTRDLEYIPNFYLKLDYGTRSHKEDFEFQRQKSLFKYSYPLNLYIKNEERLEIELQMKFNQMNKNNFENEFMNEKLKKKKKKRKNQIDLLTAQKLYSMMELSYKKDATGHRKLPLNMLVKGTQRQIGSLEFDIQIVFKSKKQKQQLQVHKKKQLQVKNKPVLLSPEKKEVKKYEAPKNGKIIINSIIGKLEMSNDDIIRGKNVSIQLKLGKNSQLSSILQDPGKQLIWIDTFTFTRTWEETIKFVIFIHNFDNKPIPTYYTQVNIRDLFELGRYMAKKLQLKDDKLEYSGSLTIDMTYKEEQEKKQKQKKKKIVIIEKTPEEIQLQKQQKKRKMILERMQKRSEEKKQREDDLKSEYPTFSEKQLFLPPLRQKSLESKTILSGKRAINLSVNMYNQGGIQHFSKSPRFEVKKQPPIPFLFTPSSEFGLNKKKGASIGYGQKLDFTKQSKVVPGVGRYQMPSVWDKYKYK